MTLLPGKTKRRESLRDANIRGPRKSVYGYSTSQVLDTEDLLQVMPVADGRERR